MQQDQQQQPNDNVPTAKVVLIGDGATGKTTFVTRHKTGEFEKQYIPTIWVYVRNLDFWTNRGHIRYLVWDTAGQEKFGGLRDAFYLNCQAAMIFFDVTARATYEHVGNWYKDLTRLSGTNIPMVLIGNKIDTKEREVKSGQVNFNRVRNMAYFEISAKLHYNLEKPWLYITRRLFNDNTVEFTEQPCQQIQISPDLAQFMDRQRQLAEQA